MGRLQTHKKKFKHMLALESGKKGSNFNDLNRIIMGFKAG
jgi:hypothetical protein